MHRIARLFLVAACAAGAAACTRSVEGTYTDASGMMRLELKDDGRATFALGPISEECTYSVDDDRVPVTCAGEEHVFTVAGDSLMGGEMLGVLHKQD